MGIILMAIECRLVHSRQNAVMYFGDVIISTIALRRHVVGILDGVYVSGLFLKFQVQQ